MMAKRGTFSHIQRTISQLSEMVELFGTLYLSEGLEKVVAQIFFRSQYTCGEARRKIWDKKSMLNFSRQAYNEKVTNRLSNDITQFSHSLLTLKPAKQKSVLRRNSSYFMIPAHVIRVLQHFAFMTARQHGLKFASNSGSSE